MRQYEMMYIIQAHLDEEQTKDVITRIANIVESQGGQIDKTNEMGKRRLAYEINDVHEGYYVVLTFKSEPEALAEMERQISLTNQLIRHLIVSEDE